jgi:hypothetical protein
MIWGFSGPNHTMNLILEYVFQLRVFCDKLFELTAVLYLFGQQIWILFHLFPNRIDQIFAAFVIEGQHRSKQLPAILLIEEDIELVNK